MIQLSRPVWQIKSRVALNQAEQDRLVRAIDSALEVTRRDQFHVWLSGPFRELLPHDFLVCVVFSGGEAPKAIDGLHRGLVGQDVMNALCHAQQGLALRLAKMHRHDRRQSCALDKNAFAALLVDDEVQVYRHMLNNVVIHRLSLLSGVVYSCLLFNVPQDQMDRCRHLFRLVASHLKMVLSRVMPKHHWDIAALTPREIEILRYMSQGKSNREISAHLGISAITVKSHVSKLYRKLDVQNRDEAVSLGLIAAGSPLEANQE